MKLKAWQLIVLLGFAFAGASAAAATPTVDDIYQAARAGHLDQAQQMVDQVVAEHPKSAKAHYVAAEIYAREGKVAVARNELQTAEQLEPGLPFAKPQSVAELKSVLAAPAALRPAQSAAQPSFPWGTIVLLALAVGIIVMVIKSFAARNAASQVYYPGGGAPGQAYPGYGPAGGPYPAAPGGGLGSGIMGGLATGAAVGAGMVAGEALAHHFLDGDNAQTAQVASNGLQPAEYVQNNDMGGNDFGLNDAGSWDDSTTYADLSSGDIGGGDWT